MEYNTEDVVKAIIDLAKGPRTAGIVSNRSIYKTVTGLTRYSKKRWEIIKPTLDAIAIKREFNIDGVKYLLQSYSPMFAGQYNFYRSDSRDWVNRIPVAGFQVSKR